MGANFKIAGSVENPILITLEVKAKDSLEEKGLLQTNDLYWLRAPCSFLDQLAAEQIVNPTCQALSRAGNSTILDRMANETKSNPSEGHIRRQRDHDLLFDYCFAPRFLD